MWRLSESNITMMAFMGMSLIDYLHCLHTTGIGAEGALQVGVLADLCFCDPEDRSASTPTCGTQRVSQSIISMVCIQ
jgi:hypothetical protein